MASKRGVRRKMCGNKRKYKSKEEAYGIKNRMRRQEKMKGVAIRVNVYKCPHCGYFHMGHAPQRKRTRRKEFI